MPHADADGVKLYYEETGTGVPVIFVHEFAGDHRSWEPQVRFLSRRYRCITFNARGYPPSEVPEDEGAYSQARATDDIAAVLRQLGVDRAHVVGLSMGAFAAVHFGLRHAEMALSVVAAGGGYGSKPEQRAQFVADSLAFAERYEAEGSQQVADWYAAGPFRVQLKRKDPRAWEEFRRQLAGHSAKGAALTMRGVQSRRPSFWDMREALAAMTVPILIVAGDEDDWSLEPSIFLKRTIPTAGLWVVPQTGHTINLEEPDAFNRAVWYFFDLVESGRWGARDPQAAVTSALLPEQERLLPHP
jgi:pimeloyl-ACP methyl ester carboxylesterase